MGLEASDRIGIVKITWSFLLIFAAQWQRKRG
jgi:hypothetical protein